MDNLSEYKYLFRNLNVTDDPCEGISPKDPNAHEELWVFIKSANKSKRKKYQFVALTKGFDVILKNDSPYGFVVIDRYKLQRNLNKEYIHDCSTTENVYREASKYPEKKRREPKWYKIAASYAVASKEVDIARESIPPNCYFYVSREEMLAMYYENSGSVIDYENKDKCEKAFQAIENNHFIGEWNTYTKIEAEKEEYSKLFKKMLKLDEKFKSKRLSTGYTDLSFRERFVKVIWRIDERYQNKIKKGLELSMEEYKKELLEDSYEDFKVFENKYLFEFKQFSGH